MKPYIGDVTYNMQYKQFPKIPSKKVQEAKGCKGYEEFKEDIARLRKTRKNCGRPTIMANFWMRIICNKSKTEIRKSVDNYKKGLLVPYQYEPKEREFSKENGLMDEDEEDFIGGI